MTEETHADTFNFQAEVQQLLNLVIHSLYSNKEIFLRELISNASDALGRYRFESMTNPEMREGDIESSIDIEIEKRPRTITIRDNGIGMNRDEVVSNIGTIARSGTKRFVEALSGEQSKDTRLIGQFGVGFYSAFMVAEKVTLRTRKAGEPADSGVVWTSDGESGFSIDSQTIEDHGTTITLELRKDAKEFLDEGAVTEIVKKYSDNVSLPIRVRTLAKGKENEWQTVNNASALWTRPRKDITEEEYNNFYQALTYDYSEPFLRLHNRVEGKLEYTALLYVPSRAPFDMFDRDRRYGVKLYVRRIFIMDDAENLMPAYLRFVRGVIDSDDLPLNVSREFLQKNKLIDRIKAGAVRKILSELKRLATRDADKYQEFWQQFGKVLKEGIFEDEKNKDTVADLLRFASTKSESSDTEEVSLAQYVERMPEKQEAIYYVVADSRKSAAGSPHLEIFRKHDIEVLLMSDPVDEWVVMHLDKYADKPLKSIAKGDLSLDAFTDEESESQEPDTQVGDLIARLRNTLTGRADDVRATTRLTDSPSCIVANENDISSHLRRMLEASGQPAPALKPILEINPEHPLIRQLAEMDDGFEDWANVLFDNAVLSEGAVLDDPSDYVKRVTTLLTGQTEAESRIITL